MMLKGRQIIYSEPHTGASMPRLIPYLPVPVPYGGGTRVEFDSAAVRRWGKLRYANDAKIRVIAQLTDGREIMLSPVREQPESVRRTLERFYRRWLNAEPTLTVGLRESIAWGQADLQMGIWARMAGKE